MQTIRQTLGCWTWWELYSQHIKTFFIISMLLYCCCCYCCRRCCCCCCCCGCCCCCCRCQSFVLEYFLIELNSWIDQYWNIFNGIHLAFLAKTTKCQISDHFRPKSEFFFFAFLESESLNSHKKNFFEWSKFLNDPDFSWKKGLCHFSPNIIPYFGAKNQKHSSTGYPDFRKTT